MNWEEYTKEAIKTSTHNTREKRITCCLLGLLGEVFELQEKIQKQNLQKEEERNTDLIKYELGDACWYLNVLCYEIGYTPIIPEDRPKENIIKFIANLQELMKKDYRDFDYAINEKYKERIHENLNYIYFAITDECDYRKWELSEILQMNIDKLNDRKERNQLMGEGDER